MGTLYRFISNRQLEDRIFQERTCFPVILTIASALPTCFFSAPVSNIRFGVRLARCSWPTRGKLGLLVASWASIIFGIVTPRVSTSVQADSRSYRFFLHGGATRAPIQLRRSLLVFWAAEQDH